MNLRDVCLRDEPVFLQKSMEVVSIRQCRGYQQIAIDLRCSSSTGLHLILDD